MHIKYRPQGERQTVETSNTVSGKTKVQVTSTSNYKQNTKDQVLCGIFILCNVFLHNF